MLRLELSGRGLLLIGLALLGVWALFRLWPVLLLVVTAFIFMAALLPYVEWLVRHSFPRAVAVLTIFAAIFAVLAGAFAVVIPALIDETTALRDNLPEDARRIEDFLGDYGIDVELEDRARELDWGEVISGRAAVDWGQRVLFWVLSLFTILVMTAYLLVESPRLSRFLYQFVPPGREPEVEQVLGSLNRVVGGYVRGQFITSIAIGVFTSAVMLVAGVPNALAFGLLAAFADIIPLVGAFIATAPPVVSALHESPGQAAFVLIALLIYQQFEDRYLTPKVYGQSLDLPPIVVLIAVLIGGQLLGVAGILLAIPAAAAGKVAMDYVLDRRRATIAPPGPGHEVAAPDNPDGIKPEKETIRG